MPAFPPLLLLGALLLLAALSAPADALTVWPKPQQQIDGEEVFVIDPTALSFTSDTPSDIIHDAFKRYRGIILLHSAANVAAAAEAVVAHGLKTISEVSVHIASPSTALNLETDESYNLTVGADGVTLHSETVFGAINGLETLSQLVDRGCFVNATKIMDAPRYQFRASMIDTSRHFYPVEAILQHLDAMAYSKFNVLHWHIVDAISFPFQSQKYPVLSESGAYSPDHVYTFDDVRNVVAYARLRGIRVIPEFDTPGHVRAGYLALDPPILTQCYDPKTGKPLTGTAATGPLDPTLDATYTFLKNLYAEMKEVFPDSFVHVGGDEVPSACWASNPGVQQYMKAHNLTSFADLETLFEQRLLDLLKEQGTSYIVWQEIFDNGAKIADDTVIDVWKGNGWQDEMSRVSKAGFHSVLSAPFYLNYISYGEDWPKYYSVEPSDFDGGKEAQAAGLIGGLEACMWSEYVDATNFIPRTWPRIAAVGERAWSHESVTDVNDARHRLHEFRCKLLRRGINAEPITDGGSDSELGGRNYCPEEWQTRYDRPWDN
eukprot:g3060.t1